MKLSDIDAEISYEFWIEPVSSDAMSDLEIGKLKPLGLSNEYNLLLDQNMYKVRLRDLTVSSDLEFHLKRGCANLVQIIQTAFDGSALLRIVFFYGEVVDIGDVEVGIDERILTTARKNGIKFRDVDELAQIFSDRCTLNLGDDTYFVMMCGEAAREDFEIQDPRDDYDVPIPEDKYRQFSLHGDRLRIPVQKKAMDKYTEVYLASRAIFRDAQRSDLALRLARGKLSFSDYTKTGAIRALAAGAMKTLTEIDGSYLKKWDQYGDVEGDLFLEKAKSIGAITHNGKPEKTPNGVKFFVSDSLPESLTIEDNVEFSDELPIYVSQPNMSWARYRETIEEKHRQKVAQAIQGETTRKAKDKVENTPNQESLRILSIEGNTLELKLDFVPDVGKYIVWSPLGDQTQIERRMRARSAILSGRSANPLLGLIIEENGEIPEVQRVTKIKPLSPLVKTKIFEHPPNVKQVEAINIALNTPDIALIQGPPGTGKTTVITAILERLNEVYDKSSSVRGQVLVSGFQHDAVENIVSRLSVNALPAVKFGRKSSGSNFTEDVVTTKMSIWCQEIADKVRKQSPQLQETEHQRELSELFFTYSLRPSKNNSRALVKGILELPSDILSGELVAEAKHILDSFSQESRVSHSRVLLLVRALRVSREGFTDDGPSRSLDLLETIREDLDPADIDILSKASRWQIGKDLDFLADLKSLKRVLLNRYVRKPEFRAEKPREDVLKLVTKVSLRLQDTLNLTSKRDRILADFLHELEDNPDGMRESIEDYNFIFAATTQQSEGKAIRRAKNKFGDHELVKYDTVIVDEAARTSPRDLLIPMAQAEKRIILVGDHRQLPHIINEDVVKIIEEKDGDSSKSESDYVRESMFSYLFRRLKKLEAKDGIKRTVTLDAQYRCHPLLGQFVSDSFYREFGESYDSPLAESSFTQSLQCIEGKAAIWLDVPNSRGKEAKKGFSRIRTAEAQKIAEQLNVWVKSTQGASLSFGVITFYKAQVSEVFRHLEQFGISERAPDGSWCISAQYSHFDDGGERIRIGTIDSFQGMEFDITFLSMVRTQSPERINSWIEKESDYEKVKIGVFGHLMSKNRLCVSMSRQKRALIVVGDQALVESKISIDAVPELNSYYLLCRDQGLVL
ncbi:AAA domain-containing protein [bacterium]|nr:AAA domain-containing protein [bacterium]